MTPSAPTNDTAVGVVFFRPSPAQVERIAERFSGRMPVFVYDNGGLPADAAARLDAAGVTRLGEGRNDGIAAALNRLCEAAAAKNFARLFLLDQDADTSPETAQALGLALDRLGTAS
ncbi:MAG: rhamnosyltransferase, partial [Methylorubrum rhodinum]